MHQEEQAEEPDPHAEPDNQQDAPAMEGSYKHVDEARHSRDHRTSRYSNSSTRHNILTHTWIYGVSMYCIHHLVSRHSCGYTCIGHWR